MANNKQLSGNKLIAHNSIMMYLRMLITILVSLYSARIVINILGVNDYGVYSVVAGFLVLFGFLNGTMSSSSARFLSFELGTGNHEKLKETFSSCLLIHVAIALAISFVCLSFGVWFLENKLVIPSVRMQAAHYVLFLSIFSVGFQIVQSPFNAAILSHEKFGFYAYVEILNSVLKLLILFILLIGDLDKLVLYSILMTAVSFIICLLYVIYAVYNFKECSFRISFNKKIFYPIIKYSGWQLYGNMSLIAITQGVNMLLNMYYGPAMNAAYEVAAKVSGVILGLSSNIYAVVKPQIVKSFSALDYNRTLDLMQNSCRITFIMMMLVCAPLIIECHYILKIWLGIVPDNTECILILFLVWNLVVSMSGAMGSVANATGDVKVSSLWAGTLYFSVFPITYIAFKYGAPYWVPFVLNVIAVISAPLYTGYTIRKHIPLFSWKKNVFYEQVKEYFFMAVILVLLYAISVCFDESFQRLVVISLISCVMVLFFGFFVVLTKDNRKNVRNIMLRFMGRNINV